MKISVKDSQRLSGIFTPNLVPLDSKGNINENELGRYIDWLIERGVHGLFPNGSSGEFTRFTREERLRIGTIVLDRAQGRVPVLVCAVEEESTRETIRLCERYHELGARAAVILPPYYFKVPSEGVYAWCREIAIHSPIDIVLYNIPLFASPIEGAVVKRLADECPRIIGIKDSSGDLTHMMRMIAAIRPSRPDFSFMTGWDMVLLPMLLMGCDGGTNSSSGVFPELMVSLYNETIAGRLEQARELQFRLLTLVDAMFLGLPFPEGFRTALNLRGFNFGKGRQNLSPAQVKDIELRRGQLKKLMKTVEKI